MARLAKPWYRADRDSYFVTVGGKRHNLGSNKKKAYERYYQLKAGRPEVQPAVASVTQPRRPATKKDYLVADVIGRFLDWLKTSHRAADTYEWYRYRLVRFSEKYPTLKISKLRPHHAQTWVDSYPDFAQTTRRNYLRSIKRCCRWARKQGYCSRNPLAGLEVPSGEAKEVFIRKPEFDTLRSFIRDPNFLCLCVICYQTGCRPQEVLRVEVEHFDRTRRRWVLPRSKSKGKKKPRIVYLSDFAFEATEQALRTVSTGPIFRNRNGRPWTTDAVNCGFDRLQVRMGKAAMAQQGIALADAALEAAREQFGEDTKWQDVPERMKIKIRDRVAKKHARRYSLYAFRHSWATNALEAGVDALTVATLMGHSDPSMLARVYSHISSNPGHMHEQAVRAIGQRAS